MSNAKAIEEALLFERTILGQICFEQKMIKDGDRNIFEVVNQIQLRLREVNVEKWLVFMRYLSTEFVPAHSCCPPECCGELWKMLFYAVSSHLKPIDFTVGQIMRGVYSPPKE